jgi:hypothetical protein
MTYRELLHWAACVGWTSENVSLRRAIFKKTSTATGRTLRAAWSLNQAGSWVPSK